MRSERPIHLDVGVPSDNAFSTQADLSGQADSRSQQQLADQAQTLRDLLDQQRAAPAPEPEQAPSATSPFALFLPSSAAPSLPATAQEPPPAALEQTLAQMAQRLLIGDGNHGRRAVQIQLADEQLPGVVVDIFEDSGRLVSRFTCSNESSRERLNAGASWFANSLAQRLQRDTRVEVQTDDPEDLCLLQVDANH
jgi:hypothetical protein